MLPTTQRKTIDYDAIYTGLLEQVTLYSQQNIDMMFGISIEQELREFRTIGVTAPRQCGKTQWLIKMLNEDPDTSAVFYNNNLLQAAKHYMADVTTSRLFTAREIVNGLKDIPSDSLFSKDIAVNTRKIFVDDAFRTIDYIGWHNFYKWLGKQPHAKELIIVNVG